CPRSRRSFRRPPRAAFEAQAVRALEHRSEPGGGPRTRLPTLAQGRLTEEESLFGPAAFELSKVEDVLRGAASQDPPEVGRPMVELLEAGGKRIRPALVVLAAMWGTYDPGLTIPAGMAVERTPVAALVHDDGLGRP